MRVFLDTNVLASAFGTRGLCADLLQVILGKHELATGEVVIEELRRVLIRKFDTRAVKVNDVERFLRGYHVEPRPRQLPNLALLRNSRRSIHPAAGMRPRIALWAA